MPKIVFVGQIGWLVANTKTKRKKLRKKNCKGPQIVKKKCLCSFYVIMTLHANIFVCRSNGLTCGQYKNKEEKTPKNIKNENFKKLKKKKCPIAIKNIFSKN